MEVAATLRLSQRNEVTAEYSCAAKAKDMLDRVSKCKSETFYSNDDSMKNS